MPAWWEQAAVLQIYPRSFADSDGDGVGDLDGITSRLDHAEWLGVDAIWLSPIYPSPLDDFGYDISDHAAVAAEYGGLEAFERLIAAAHARGLRVLLDLVPCHTSIEHPWFSHHRDRYVWSAPTAGGGPPNNWIASFGGPAWSPDPAGGGKMYLHSFFAEQPDLDWRNPEVREAMGTMISGWIDRGVDGFRVDAIDRLMKDPELRDDPHSATPFPLPVVESLRDRDLIHSRDAPDIGVALATIRDAAGEEAALIGEVYLPAERLDPYLDALDRVFSFDLLHSPWEAEAIAGVLAAEATRSADGGAERLAWVISNHDFSRVATRWGEAAVRPAAMLLLTLPGPAFVYQGEELGQADGPGSPAGPLDRFGRDAFRHPVRWSDGPGGGFSTGAPWLPVPGDELADAASQRADPDSVAALYKRLIAARRELEGPISEVEASGGRFSFRRGDRHRVVLNLDAEPVPLPAGELLVQTTAAAIGPAGELQGGGAVLLAIVPAD